jgi:hypothetical protein
MVDIFDENSILITHVALDYLSYKDGMSIIQSKTGKIITRDLFYKKYKFNSARYPLKNIPFNLTLLNIFGDNQLVREKDIMVKRCCYETLTKANVNYRTTEIYVEKKIKGCL